GKSLAGALGGGGGGSGGGAPTPAVSGFFSRAGVPLGAPPPARCATAPLGRTAVILEGKRVIVSGVGPGLGGEVARIALRDGARVVIAARNAEKLATIAK